MQIEQKNSREVLPPVPNRFTAEIARRFQTISKVMSTALLGLSDPYNQAPISEQKPLKKTEYPRHMAKAGEQLEKVVRELLFNDEARKKAWKAPKNVARYSEHDLSFYQSGVVSLPLEGLFDEWTEDGAIELIINRLMQDDGLVNSIKPKLVAEKLTAKKTQLAVYGEASSINVVKLSETLTMTAATVFQQDLNAFSLLGSTNQPPKPFLQVRFYVEDPDGKLAESVRLDEKRSLAEGAIQRISPEIIRAMAMRSVASSSLKDKTGQPQSFSREMVEEIISTLNSQKRTAVTEATPASTKPDAQEKWTVPQLLLDNGKAQLTFVEVASDKYSISIEITSAGKAEAQLEVRAAAERVLDSALEKSSRKKPVHLEENGPNYTVGSLRHGMSKEIVAHGIPEQLLWPAVEQEFLRRVPAALVQWTVTQGKNEGDGLVGIGQEWRSPTSDVIWRARLVENDHKVAYRYTVWKKSETEEAIKPADPVPSSAVTLISRPTLVMKTLH